MESLGFTMLLVSCIILTITCIILTITGLISNDIDSKINNFYVAIINILSIIILILLNIYKL